MNDRDDVPYDELDPNIVWLVRTLNAFDGIRTIGSCGGHTDPDLTKGQWPEGTWYIAFEVARDDDGWFALEFLAWLIDRKGREIWPYNQEHHLGIGVTSPPPWHAPGESMYFGIEGHGIDPNEVADWIDEMQKRHYTPP